jgi:peroxiredoxin
MKGTAIGVGTTAPDFDLPDGEERRWRLRDARGRLLVLVFYRGHW